MNKLIFCVAVAGLMGDINQTRLHCKKAQGWRADMRERLTAILKRVDKGERAMTLVSTIRLAGVALDEGIERHLPESEDRWRLRKSYEALLWLTHETAR